MAFAGKEQFHIRLLDKRNQLIADEIRQTGTVDIQMTKQIADIAGSLGISVHDHIIVGKNGHASLKGLKLI